jgi:hypothetical protein
MEESKLNVSSIRLLSAVNEVVLEGYLASNDGLVHILLGDKIEETKPLINLPCFGFYRSLSSKKIKNRLHLLVRKGYLGLKYMEDSNDYFYIVLDKGKPFIDDTLFASKKALQSSKPTIIKIKGDL